MSKKTNSPKHTQGGKRKAFVYGHHCPICNSRSMTYDSIKSGSTFEVYTCDTCGFSQEFKVK